MVADDKHIQIFGYSNEDYQPYHIVTYSVDQTNLEVIKAEQKHKQMLLDSASKAEEFKSERHLTSPLSKDGC